MRSNGSQLSIRELSMVPINNVMNSQSSLLTLKKLTSVVASGKVPYEDLAEQIEDCSYTICEDGNADVAVKLLLDIAAFFENLENKNEENSRDLADVYLLIGQLYQFTENYEESIVWFKKATFVDDQYTVTYHNIALSYIKLGEFDGAIRSLVQEVMFSPGNYYSYLILADLYEKSKRFVEAEQCLKQLLERDPDNIQGIHRLILYYETLNTDIDVQLLERRLLSVKKKYTCTESLIRVFYLCKKKKYKEAHSSIQTWCAATPNETTTYLAKAFVFEKQQQIEMMHQELDVFKKLYKNRDSEVMTIKINEFCAVFGEKSTKSIYQYLIEK